MIQTSMERRRTGHNGGVHFQVGSREARGVARGPCGGDDDGREKATQDKKGQGGPGPRKMQRRLLAMVKGGGTTSVAVFSALCFESMVRVSSPRQKTVAGSLKALTDPTLTRVGYPYVARVFRPRPFAKDASRIRWTSNTATLPFWTRPLQLYCQLRTPRGQDFHFGNSGRLIYGLKGRPETQGKKSRRARGCVRGIGVVINLFLPSHPCLPSPIERPKESLRDLYKREDWK